MNAEQAYPFRHALLRDAAYQFQLPGDRARLHALAFKLVEELAGGRPPEPEPLAAVRTIRFQGSPAASFAQELAEHALIVQTAAGSRDVPEMHSARKPATRALPSLSGERGARLLVRDALPLTTRCVLSKGVGRFDSVALPWQGVATDTLSGRAGHPRDGLPPSKKKI